MNHPNDLAPTVPSCPLAHDSDGNPLELPPGAAAWRVRRKTGGRPRIVLGVDKQPMELPLGYSIVDLEDVLAPAEYLLDIVDGKGDPLSVTVAVAIGQLRNAGEDVPDNAEPTAIAAMLPTSGSETRLVLEANVRATQLAFQHNQKTLELGLRMAESLRDSVRDMATAQADWIKAMASARGFFRNAPPPLPPQVCVHSLRGLHATLATEAGQTSHAVASALGHSSPAVTHAHYIERGARRRASTKRVVAAITEATGSLHLMGNG